MSPPGPDAGPLEHPDHRAGFVAIVGLPGAGKSTLLNRLVGERLAAVHRKPQTTRRRILGIARRPALELMLVDTPGIHRPRTGLGRAMMRTVTSSLGGADVALAVVDGTRTPSGADRDLFLRLEGFSGPRVIGINKIDAAPRPRLREIEAFYREKDVGPVVLFSARTGANVDSGKPRTMGRERPARWSESWGHDCPSARRCIPTVRSPTCPKLFSFPRSSANGCSSTSIMRFLTLPQSGSNNTTTRIHWFALPLRCFWIAIRKRES